MEARLIAPCGMNCGICMAYLRKKNHCPGCRAPDTGKQVSVLKCIIPKCETVRTNESGFCYECAQHPCQRLKQLDKRYRTKYGMSMLENLENIERRGLSAFIAGEQERWRCAACGGVICVHRGYCFECGSPASGGRR